MAVFFNNVVLHYSLEAFVGGAHRNVAMTHSLARLFVMSFLEPAATV